MATIKERIARLEGHRYHGQTIDGFFIVEYGLTHEEARAEYERQHPGCDFDKVIFVEGVSP